MWDILKNEKQLEVHENVLFFLFALVCILDDDVL